MNDATLSETPIAVIFDETNVNWHAEPIHNELFLKMAKNHLNSLLLVRGHIFLNEVYVTLGLPHTKAGAISGWFHEDGSNPIEFFIQDLRDGRLRIDFNIDGVIYDKLP